MPDMSLQLTHVQSFSQNNNKTGQQWMKKATSKASKQALSKATALMVMAEQLNH
jgi:hypothetical protein